MVERRTRNSTIKSPRSGPPLMGIPEHRTDQNQFLNKNKAMGHRDASKNNQVMYTIRFPRHFLSHLFEEFSLFLH